MTSLTFHGRKIMLGVFTLAVIALPVTASTHSVEDCPALPADSGLEWVYQPGPDFYLCYAVESATKKDAFGVYFGHHPSFRAEHGTKITTGIIAGREIVWYRGASSDNNSLSLQTVVSMGHEPHQFVAHVWVSGDNEHLLRQRLQTLQRIHFKD